MKSPYKGTIKKGGRKCSTCAPYTCLHFTWTVYLHTPRVFHSLMVLSREPETICRLSEEKATLSTSLVWPTNRRVVVPLKGRTWLLSRPTLQTFLHSQTVSLAWFLSQWSGITHTTLDMALITAGPWPRICRRIPSELQDMSSLPCGDWLTMSPLITKILRYA